VLFGLSCGASTVFENRAAPSCIKPIRQFAASSMFSMVIEQARTQIVDRHVRKMIPPS